MISDDKDKKFNFITEEIIAKRGMKRKAIMRILFAVLIGIMIGMIASLTFIIATPELYKRLYGNNKRPIIFPNDETVTPSPTSLSDKYNPNGNSKNNDKSNMNLMVGFYQEISDIVNEAKKSILKVTVLVDTKDVFDNPIEEEINTTGIIITRNEDDIYLLVSWDRIKSATSIKVRIDEDIDLESTVVDYESDINMAVIKTNISKLSNEYKDVLNSIKRGDANNIPVGTPIIALGNPNGYQMSMEIGIVTSTGSVISIIDNQLDLFNTSIRDSKASDGIIINYKGELVGIITRTLKENNNIDLNTVVGINKLSPLLSKLINGMPRIYFGVMTSDMNDEILMSYGLENGIFVDEVESRSPALIGGIKQGDIIQQVDDHVIHSVNGFNNIISGHKVGEEVAIKVYRTTNFDDKEVKVKVKLTEKAK